MNSSSDAEARPHGPIAPETRAYRTAGQPELILLGVPLGTEGLSTTASAALTHLDLLICESRKNAARLYKSLQIPFPRDAYREWNEHSDATELDELLDLIWRVDRAVLISDAGMPVLADPGARLVRAMRERDVQIHSLPGPTAMTTALALAGVGGHGFQFLGFPPRERVKRIKWFADLNVQAVPQVFYETPYRLHKTLQELARLRGQSQMRLFLAVDLCLPGEFCIDLSLQEIEQTCGRIAKGNPVFILYQPGILESNRS